MNDDLISRKETLEAIEKREALMVGDKRVGVENIKNFIRNRPSVNTGTGQVGQEVELYYDPLEATREMRKRIKEGWRVSSFSLGHAPTYHGSTDRIIVVYEKVV